MRWSVRAIKERTHSRRTYRKTGLELVSTVVAEFFQQTLILEQSLLDRLWSAHGGTHDALEDIAWQLREGHFIPDVGEEPPLNFSMICVGV